MFLFFKPLFHQECPTEIKNLLLKEVLAKRQQKVKVPTQLNDIQIRENSYSLRRLSQVLSVWI